MYKYEMHQHTSACSLCAKADTVELIKALKDAGFQGVVLTNHFYHGNTAVDRKLSWKKFCEEYEKDYKVAKEVGKKLDFDVLFGIEQGIGSGKEVLIYGLSPKKLIKHKELRDGGLENIYKIVKSEGGLVIQAHPFRDREWIENPDEKLPLEFLDGFEIINRGNDVETNQKAIDYTKNMNVIKIAGSDSHDIDVGGIRFGIVTEKRIKTEKALVKTLTEGKYEIFLGEEE